ncbi:MAG: lytic transglycosylase domain-containing protein [Candidatus Latescibacteria bacterium]|nr:lytic transglycosylase domain-containing protein [Candidatus Latescibacterota bacterium]
MSARPLPWVLLVAIVIPSLVFAEQPALALFPRPPELTGAVEFWKRVFAVYGTDQGVVHDSEDLTIIYGVEGLGGRAESGRERERQQAQQAALARYRRALERFANDQVDTTRLAGDDLRVWLALGKTTDRMRYRCAVESLRLQVGQKDRFERGLTASEPYIKEMRRILRSHSVSDSLAVLPFIESAFDVRAYSKAGAAGLWQITRPTGRRFLKINRRIDERRDPFKSTSAAARILRENRDFLGNWPLAITAYNHGPNGMARAVKTLGTQDIATIIQRYKGKRFGFASRNFYPEFLAALDVIHSRLQENDSDLPASPLAKDLGQMQSQGQGRQ